MAVQRWAKWAGEARGGGVLGQDDAGVQAPAPADAGPDAGADAGAPAPAAPAGGLTVNVVQAATELTKCGSVEFKVHWNVPAHANGWVVQHVEFLPSVTDATGAAVAANNAALEYWEGWQVQDGKIFIGPATSGSEHVADTFRTVNEPARKGTVQEWGNAKFIPDYNLQSPPWGNVPEAGSLPSTKNMPAGWSDGDTLTHQMTIAFDCTGADPAQYSQGVVTTP